MITSSSLLRMARLGPPCVSVDLLGLMMGILGLELDLTRDPHPIFWAGSLSTIPELDLTWPHFIKPNPTLLLEMLPLVSATQIRKMAVQVTFPVGSLHFILLILLPLSWSRQREGKTSFQITNLPAAVVMPKPYHFLCPQNCPSYITYLMYSHLKPQIHVYVLEPNPDSLSCIETIRIPIAQASDDLNSYCSNSLDQSAIISFTAQFIPVNALTAWSQQQISDTQCCSNGLITGTSNHNSYSDSLIMPTHFWSQRC